MIKVLEVAFSCYAVTDLARARGFYEGLLGLVPATLVGNQWVEYEIGPHALSIGSSPEFKPSPDGCCVALEVEDFDGALAELKQAGVKFRMDTYESPVCHMAMVFDPDGNTVCIHKRKAL